MPYMNQPTICDSAGRLYDDPRTILKATPSAPKSNFNRYENINKMKPIRIITTVFLILLPSLALAEVSDKVPTISQLWSQGFIIGLIAFMGSIYRIWTGVISGLLALFFSFYISQILTDPFVGSAIINEQGTSYIIAVWGSIVLMIFLLTIGFVINLRKRKTT